jgi:hypothetical protein
VVVATAGAVVLAIPTASTAAPAPSEPIAQGLVGPLQLDVGSHGQVYAAQNFIGTLTKIRKNGTTKNLVSEPNEVAGVASRGYTVAFTTTNGGEDTPTTAAYLKVRQPNGHVRIVADLFKFEAKHNPDAGSVYGFRHLSQSCADSLAPLVDVIGPPTYTGLIDSHPYALANAPGGGWYVADAAGNDILKVSPKGHISVVFVLRPQKVVVSAEAAAGMGLPDCTIGKTYAFEPVPTDVEVNANGALIVSMLPGGPEDASLGARGGVIRIAGDGEFANLAHGFLGATNVAIGKGGRIYVTELFGNRLSMLRNGVISKVADLPSPAGVEYAHGKLYVSTDVFGNGSIVTINVP